MGGHSGINNTLAKISQNYIWNGMKADVTEFVSTVQCIDNISIIHVITLECKAALKIMLTRLVVSMIINRDFCVFLILVSNL